MRRSSSVVSNLLRGGSSATIAAARDASSIFLVACSITREAASMAIASRSVKCSARALWCGCAGGILSSSSPAAINKHYAINKIFKFFNVDFFNI